MKRFGDPLDTPSKDAFKIMQIKKKQWSKSENNVCGCGEGDGEVSPLLGSRNLEQEKQIR